MRSEGGNAAIATLGGVAVVMVLLVGLTDLATFFMARTRAQTAADSAVLAAVAELIPAIGDDPRGKAEEFATANGAELLSCECEMGSTEALVTVAVPVNMTFVRLEAVQAKAKAELNLPSSGP